MIEQKPTVSEITNKAKTGPYSVMKLLSELRVLETEIDLSTKC